MTGQISHRVVTAACQTQRRLSFWGRKYYLICKKHLTNIGRYTTTPLSITARTELGRVAAAIGTYQKHLAG